MAKDMDKMLEAVEKKLHMAEMASMEGLPSTDTKTFLESCAPSIRYRIENLSVKIQSRLLEVHMELSTPAIELFCKNNACMRIGFFDCINEKPTIKNHADVFLNYKCRNCEKYIKTFSLNVHSLTRSSAKSPYSGSLMKYGEFPKYGLPEPTALTNLITDPIDTELFNEGFDCENQSKGIGAYSYYRRMVDNQKDKLIDRLIEVIGKIDPDNAIIAELEEAKKEQHFSKGIEKIKHNLPKELLIDGHNPLKALYRALSVGIHDLSDVECLDYAHDVRIVLTSLLDKINVLLEDDDNVKESLHRLFKINSTPKPVAKPINNPENDSEEQ